MLASLAPGHSARAAGETASIVLAIAEFSFADTSGETGEGADHRARRGHLRQHAS
jgi:hypothetical protein